MASILTPCRSWTSCLLGIHCFSEILGSVEAFQATFKHGERPEPPVEGGRPHSYDGTLLCPAERPGASHTLAANGLTGINSVVATACTLSPAS